MLNIEANQIESHVEDITPTLTHITTQNAEYLIKYGTHIGKPTTYNFEEILLPGTRALSFELGSYKIPRTPDELALSFFSYDQKGMPELAKERGLPLIQADTVVKPSIYGESILHAFEMFLGGKGLIESFDAITSEIKYPPQHKITRRAFLANTGKAIASLWLASSAVPPVTALFETQNKQINSIADGIQNTHTELRFFAEQVRDTLTALKLDYITKNTPYQNIFITRGRAHKNSLNTALTRDPVYLLNFLHTVGPTLKYFFGEESLPTVQQYDWDNTQQKFNLTEYTIPELEEIAKQYF